MLPALAAAAVPAIASLVGGKLSGDRQEALAHQNMMQQILFAKHGIQWKVEDAKAAGIHPLYALGASTQSYSPVSIGGDDLGSGLAKAGQDIGRALTAGQSGSQREAAFETGVKKLQLEGLGLDNDIKRARLASMVATTTQAGTPPPLADTASVPEADKAEDRPVLIAGGRWRTSPRFVNAEDVEKRYGDAAQEIYGLPLFVGEAMDNLWSRARAAYEFNTRIAPMLRRYRGSQNWRGHF